MRYSNLILTFLVFVCGCKSSQKIVKEPNNKQKRSQMITSDDDNISLRSTETGLHLTNPL